MQPTDYQNIGQYLKESRESLHVSLETAATDLHIRVRYLRALENGDLEDMPGKAYVRGYIQTYAHYLRLDAKKVLDAYGFLLVPKAQNMFIPEATLQKNLPSRKVLVFCLAALCLIYGFWYVSLHDRTELSRMVADLPLNLAHLLDKPPPAMMDKAWESCLYGDDAGCYVAARAGVIPRYALFYDLQQLDQTPQQP